jgi:hypothetical protein
MPKISDSAKALIFVRTAGVGNVDLSNYYNKQETDEMLAEKLSTSELDNAIDQALSKAKESGEFKGEKGEQGIQGERGEKGEQGVAGKDGKDGANGISATHSWNGTTLTITSASGTSSANLKGERGEKGEQGEQGEKGADGAKGEKGDTGATGYTPVKGTDYFTDADKKEFFEDLKPTIQEYINTALEEVENGTY